MASNNKQVAIIGGGVAGMGAALGLLEHGIDVTIIDKQTCGEGTSKASLRIMHGGFRYLQSLDLPRVLFSLKAKKELQIRYPGFVHELTSFMSLSGKKLERLPFVWCGAQVYGALQKFFGDVHHVPTVLTDESFKKEHPSMASFVGNGHGVLAWSDGTIADHAGFIKHLHKEIVSKGGEIIERVPVNAVTTHRNQIEVAIGTNKKLFDWVIDTTGNGIVSGRPLSKAIGFNLILKRKICDNYGVGFRSRTGRLFFIVPRGEVSVLGTGYEPLTAEINPNSKAVRDFICDAMQTNPGLGLREDDIGSVEVGVLPARSEVGDAKSLIERTALVKVQPFCTEYNLTKYTTFLADGRVVAAAIAKELA